MKREYAIRSADWSRGPDGEHYLARDIIVTEETVDIGIVDQFGNKIVARKRADPVGFVRFRDNG